ncbi:spherulation-specific family 4 protein [Dietzia kunjamensis]|uniref:spherulation-specific family 4 protein n=1 Tax=Dietzia kunjamensis TaxID=322509 RepID=UPI0024B95CF1|nr:spherulation-specific family 4 protein [Dietzia kunjamensis]MDJ0422016.1 spherulation-specific family 4 protein [Dietzia kunjamensis]
MSAPRAAVPLYVHPVVDSALWERVLRPGAADLVVVNVDSGPGHAPDPVFAEALHARDHSARDDNARHDNARDHSAPATLLGYVDTDYGRRDMHDVRAEARLWRDRYGVTSVLLDQVISGAGPDGRVDVDALVAFTDLAHELRRDGVAMLAGNPGTVPHPRVLRLLDVTCVRETDLETHLTAPAPPVPDVDPARLWHLIYDCPPERVRDAVERSAELGAGFVGLAADGLPHPWGSVEYLNADRPTISSAG